MKDVRVHSTSSITPLAQTALFLHEFAVQCRPVLGMLLGVVALGVRRQAALNKQGTAWKK